MRASYVARAECRMPCNVSIVVAVIVVVMVGGGSDSGLLQVLLPMLVIKL